jgi:hypothetical protein
VEADHTLKPMIQLSENRIPAKAEIRDKKKPLRGVEFETSILGTSVHKNKIVINY